ncbi:MAG TPA: TatD family hydrolase [Candidatus Hydrogenedentes bacterium]|nr:TatD family hydrolase [Candidatus Hydrogenedentota bacterium]HRK35895.1 TatD family hydrolase [Candidatus Hydrogenedentota bacterium]
MRPVDTHCHLHDAAFDADRAEVTARALEALEWIVLIGDDIAASQKAVSLTAHGIFAAVGVHPYHPEQVTPENLDILRGLATRPSVVAIGEIGLDYYIHNDAPRDAQQRAFHAQLRLAAELALPVVIHNRDSDEDALSILREHDVNLPAVIMHCFSGGPSFAELCIERDYYISFAGNVTYPKATLLRSAAQVVPMNRLLVETDSPYLSPQPHRGKRCEPSYVVKTAAALAAVKGIAYDDFVEQTTANATRVFLSRRG